MRIVIKILAPVAVFVLGYSTAHIAERGNSPAIYCGVQESDCRPDFRGNGKWVVYPDGKN